MARFLVGVLGLLVDEAPALDVLLLGNPASIEPLCPSMLMQPGGQSIFFDAQQLCRFADGDGLLASGDEVEACNLAPPRLGGWVAGWVR